MRHRDDSSVGSAPRLKLKEGVVRSPLEQRIATLEQKVAVLTSASQYQDDFLDVASLLPKLKEGVSRSAFEHRMAILERKVSELTNIINGLTVQLAEQASTIREIKRLAAVHEDADVVVKQDDTKKESKPGKKGKTEYIIAENDYPIQEERASSGKLVIADKDR